MSVGKVYLVGAGPGDPELLTLRGRDVLARANVVVYDALLTPRVLDHAPESAERVYVGKRAGNHAMEQDEINRLLVARARGGAVIVRLKGGDPFVFGRGGEESLALAEAGIPFEIVPGVTAGLAAAACAGIPVTHRGIASCVTLVTGHEAPGSHTSMLDWSALARTKGTLVFYMGVENAAGICDTLVEHGLSPTTPACLIRWGTTPQQRVVNGDLRSLPDAARTAGITPPAVLVIGEVVGLRSQLRWFETRPLFGRRIVVTRARAQASESAAQFAALGAEVIEVPAIRIEPPLDSTPLREAVARLDAYSWIIFTSVHAVDAFFGALRAAGRDARAMAALRIAAIGQVTAERLNAFGLLPDVRPAEYTGAAVAEALAATDVHGARILCPRADAATTELPDALTRLGATVTEVVAYRTLPDCQAAPETAEMIRRGEVHWLTFASSSAVTSFFSMIEPSALAGSATRIASIGPVTSRALRHIGLAPHVEATPHTISGLVEAVLQEETKS